MEAVVELKDGELRALQPGYYADSVYVDAAGYKWFGVESTPQGHQKGLLLLSPDDRHWFFYVKPSFSFSWSDNIAGDNRGNLYIFGIGNEIRRLTPP